MSYNLTNLKNDEKNGVIIPKLFFWRPYEEYGVFSQWYKSVFTDGSFYYNCAEQYMMARKASLMGDLKTFTEIMNETNPKEIQRLGRIVNNFDKDLWNREKKNIVVWASLLKFSQNSELKKILLGTGDKILVEASPYDDIWGIKMAINDRDIMNVNKWRGENLLGFSLMEARDIIRVIEKNG